MENNTLISSEEFEKRLGHNSAPAQNVGVQTRRDTQPSDKPNLVVDKPIVNTVSLDNDRQPIKRSPALRVMFLGGVNEIGKNMTVLEYGDDIIVIDCGLMFPTEDMLGIDLVVPDITFLLANRNRIRGIVITHAHEDHIGALPYVLGEINAPIYASKLSLGLIAKKMDEHKKISYKGNAVKACQKITLGAFEVEFIHVNHSIPGSFALGIKTPVGNVIHSGDVKIDFTPVTGAPIDLSKFAEYGSRGVLLYLADSTNAVRPGYSMSEKTVSHTMEELFQEHAGRRIIIATFASNLHRLEEVMRLAEKYKRKVCFTGRSMVANIDVAAKLGEITVNKANLIEVDNIKNVADSEVCIMCTGSQGEPLSALSRMASGEFKGISVTNNDTIIFSSSPVPGNEKSVSNSINNLMMLGAQIIYNQLADIHASGHASQQELRTLMALVKPTYFIPVHGEQCHLQAHKQIALSMGVPERNVIIPALGMRVELTRNSMRVNGSVPFGTRLIDGAGVGEMDSMVLRERKQLSEDGLCIVIVNVNIRLGTISGRPEIISRGFTYQGEANVWLEEAKDTIISACENVDIKNRDYPNLKLTIKKSLTNFLAKKMKRKPLIIPMIVES